MQKIFLAEDDEYLSRVYERAFRFAEYEVETAADGEEALGKLTAAEPVPSAVLLDFRLPKMDGYELLQALRRDTRYDLVPIIILTNSTHEDETVRFLAAGADLYLIKIEEQTKDVVQKVQELIQKGRTSAMAGV